MAGRPRIAIVGAGAFGRLHAETLRGLGEADLTAVCDTDARRARQLARHGGDARTFTSMAALVAANAADAVIIATHADSHVPLAMQALAANLDVLLEKPAGKNQRELARLEKRRVQRSRVVMVDHICLFHSLVNPLLRRVRAGGFRAAHFVRHRHPLPARSAHGETPLHLSMVHDLYVAARLVDGAEPVDWELTETSGPDGRIDMTWALLRWADGRVATFHSHWTLPASSPIDGWDSIEIFGKSYHTRVDTNPSPWAWSGRKRIDWPVSLEISTVEGKPAGMLAAVQRSFLAAIKGAAIPEGCRLIDALQIQRWSDRLQKISKGRKP